MALADRLVSLRQQHAHLEIRLDEENTRPHPDEDRLRELKRQKLRLKDEMSRIEHRAQGEVTA